MNLLDNWLIQAIIGSFVYSLLCKFSIAIYKAVTSTKNTMHSKKSLRNQFYICLLITFISLMFFVFNVVSINSVLSLPVFIVIGWSIIIIVFSFECAIEKFVDDGKDKRD